MTPMPDHIFSNQWITWLISNYSILIDYFITAIEWLGGLKLAAIAHPEVESNGIIDLIQRIVFFKINSNPQNIVEVTDEKNI